MNKGQSAEEYVYNFANTVYLKHWCYPNPVDESGDKKEICDLLILFKHVCIIISVKNYDLKGNRDRFRKKVIEKSTQQLYGAERKLFDSKREIRFNHPDRGIETFEPIKYTTIIRLTINMGEMFEAHEIADIKDGKGIINIIHRDSFSNMIKELNTIPDLVNYLVGRETFLLNNYPIYIMGCELDLLGYYLSNRFTFPNDLSKDDKGINSVDLRSIWGKYLDNDIQTKRKKESELESYIIDKLVKRDILKEEWGPELAEELMYLNRTERRYLAYNLYQIVEKYKANNELIGRRHFEINGILFLTMSYPTGQSKELVDRLIEDAAQIYMYKLNYKYEKIVVLGTPYDLSESKYGIIIQKEDASKEAKDYLENLCNQYGWFQDMKISKSDFKI
jgi:hypothetical protein